MWFRIKSSLTKACLIGLSAGLIWGGGVLAAGASQNQTHYTVQRGDSLWAIANRLGTSITALRQANNLRSDLIFPGQLLVVPGAGGPATVAELPGEPVNPVVPPVPPEPVEPPKLLESAVPPEPADAAEPPTTTYSVKSGDSLWSIARKFGVSVDDLKAANNLRNDFLSVGQQLVIPNRKPAVTTNPTPSRSGDRVQTILDYARTLHGHRYRWGGSSPGGFDCSGFVYHVFDHHGITLPRTSYEQFKAGNPVSRQDLRPGDLVFFTTYASGASHVGIYFGNGQFLHGSSAGGSVIWTDMNSHQYYSNRFLGGRRVLP